MPGRVRRAATLLFWGAVVVFFDFTVGGVDLVNDVVGMGLVVTGLNDLVPLGRGEALQRLRGARILAAVVLALTVVAEITRVGSNEAPGWLVSLVGLLSVVGTILLADGMRRVSEGAGAEGLAQSWRLTSLLLLVLAGVPAMLLAPMAVGADDSTSPSGLVVVNTDLSAVVFITVIVMVMAMVVPFLHLLISLDRTRRRGAPLEASAA